MLLWRTIQVDAGHADAGRSGVPARLARRLATRLRRAVQRLHVLPIRGGDVRAPCHQGLVCGRPRRGQRHSSLRPNRALPPSPVVSSQPLFRRRLHHTIGYDAGERDAGTGERRGGSWRRAPEHRRGRPDRPSSRLRRSIVAPRTRSPRLGSRCLGLSGCGPRSAPRRSRLGDVAQPRTASPLRLSKAPWRRHPGRLQAAPHEETTTHN